jgi:hypothetical protein
MAGKPKGAGGSASPGRDLAAQGNVEITFEREKRARTRIIHIITTEPPIALGTERAQPPGSSAPSTYLHNANRLNDGVTVGVRTVVDLSDGSNGGINSTVRATAMKSHNETDADGADANIPSRSARKNARWRATI